MPDRSQRLAILTSSLGGGGAQRSMVKLAGGIADRGYGIDLVLGHADGHYASEVHPSVRIVDLRARKMVLSIPSFARYLRHERPRAVLSSLNHVNIVGLWARRLSRVSTRMVVSERNTLSMAKHGSWWRQRLRPHLIGRFYRWADAIVAVSEGVSEDLSSATGLSPESIAVIPNPIITPNVRRMAEESLDHPWLSDGEPPVVLAVGRLAPQKDFGTLIAAFAEARGTTGARLLILGDGPERTILETLARGRGLQAEVAMPGWVDNPYPFLRHAALFALSSRWEGLPGVLIEALFCGVPIVATDCPSGPREILEGGRHGRLVPVGDVDALAGAIQHGLAGEIARPSASSWQPYEQEAVVTRYLDVLIGA